MGKSQSYRSFAVHHPGINKKLVGILCAVFTGIVGLMIFQDYLEALRQGISFYFSESILFKIIWFLFIPILPVLYKRLRRQKVIGSYSTVLFIMVPVIVHYLIIPVVFLTFSLLLYGGRYDLYKILTYTLANDLSILILVYSTFVLGFRYFSQVASAKAPPEEKVYPESLVVNNGKNNCIIPVSEIVQIAAASPYVAIQLKNRKYLHTATLRSMTNILDKKDFIRVHKSAIVNIHKVISFKSRLNGDYDLMLETGEEIRLSRTYAPDFKKRFNQGKRVTT